MSVVYSVAARARPAAGPRADSNYLATFGSVFLLYAACTFGLHYFMLDYFASDFLEANWLAFGDDPRPVLTSFIGLVLVAHLVALNRPLASDFFVTLLAMIPVVPMLALYAYRGAAPAFMAATIGCFVLVWLGIRAPLPGFRLKALEVLPAERIPAIALGAAAVFLLASIALGGLRYVNFNFADVYDYRFEALESRGAIFEYAGTNVTGMLLPLAIGIALSRKMWREVALLFLAGFMIFGFTSHKSHFFIPLFATALFYAARRRNTATLLMLLASVLLVVPTLLYVIGRGEGLATIAVRRIFFVPAYVNYLYYDYFAQMPKMWWSDNRLSFGLVNNPYGVHSSRVIMNAYTGGSFAEAFSEYSTGNTGFLGSGYGEAGFLGMAVYTAIIVLLLRCTNLMALKIGRVATSAGLGHLFGTVLFASTDTLTTFASYGVALFVLLAFIVREAPPEAAPAGAIVDPIPAHAPA